MRLRHAGIATAVSAALVVSLAPSAFALDPVTPTLIRLTNTAAYSPPAPDPMGITYVPWTNHLLMSDSEVEEIPALFTGQNLFETSLSGTLLRTGTTIGWSNEPTGVAVDPGRQLYLFSDDDGDQVVMVNDGADNLVGNADDTRTSFSTRPFGGTDIEGIAFAAGDIFVVDGVGTEVYRITDGANNVFDGVDDVVTHFDVAAAGQSDPEGIDYNAARGTLSVISNVRQSPISEFALDGTPLGNINVASIDMRHASGLAFGPSSVDATKTSAYVSDRGVDNNFQSDENDGKIYELGGFGGGTVSNFPPQVTNPGTKTTFEGDPASEQIVATDSDGPNALSYSATGLPPGLTINATTGLISGTITLGAAANSPYSVDVAVSDGLNTSHAVFPWVVRDRVPPATPTGFTSTSTTRQLNIDWNDNTETDLAGYQVERATTSGGPYTLLTPTPITVSQFTDPGALPGVDTFYRITAVDTSTNISLPLDSSAHRISIAYRSSSTTHRRTGTSVSVAKPAGAATNDVLVASISARASATITAPSGWTQVQSQLSGTVRTATFVHVVGSEAGPYVFTLSTSTSATAVTSAYSGVNTTTPVVASSGGTGTGSSIVAPATSGPGALVATFGIAAGASITQPAGMVENAEAKQKAGKFKVAVEQADQVVPAGSTGSRTATANKSAANVGLLIVLQPL
jgi:Putative Ig domain